MNVLSSDSITNPTTTITPPTGSSYIARIGNPDDPGKYVWENRLMQSFDAGAKSLSLQYNFFSRDNSNDIPGFFIRLNGQEIFRKNDLGSDFVNAASTGWTQFMYDLSGHTDPKVNLALYAGNTSDTSVQSWVYVADVTTYFVSAPSHATYTITGADTGGAGINHYEYQIDGGSWTNGDTFSVPANGDHTIGYRSVDNAGNSFTATVKLITDATAPSAVTDLSATTTENTATLSWTAPGNDDGTPPTGRAALYDIRYQKMDPTATDCTGFIFDTAILISKPPSPGQYGAPETLEILGIDPASNYCFALKSSDEAPNTSVISNIFFATTAIGTAVNPGDVVINELMWMGSSVSPNDEWLELLNMTNRTVDLTGLTLTKLSAGSDVAMAIDLTGKTIAPNGYFLIANGNLYAGGDSRLKNTLTPNMWDASLDLNNTELQIKLMQGATVIDVAWDGTAPSEGIFDTTPGSEKYYSTERISTPSNGANPLEWYTTIDAASTNDFFDGGVDERGTPGAKNRSENEPLAHQKLQVRDTVTATESADVVEQEVIPEFTEVVGASEAAILEEPAPTIEPIASPSATPTAIPEPTTEPTPEPTSTPEPTAIPTQSIEPTPAPITDSL
ncbi:MAG: lamin tail domain-containing protein [Patescibacteria group bacterium]